MFIFVSDIDYAYNPVTKQHDIPSVEWESEMGRWWQQFDSEEERSKALAENEAFNNRPENRDEIEAEQLADEIHMSNIIVGEYLEMALEYNERVQYNVALDIAVHYAIRNEVKQAIAVLVIKHNKALIKASRPPKIATYCLGDAIRTQLCI